ncbi:hypothetical protein ASZ90_014833 [hydrocarbon metagenome]|uniref:Uncharacterized protein n=1 Tax=hydrocarbon metagenome TaxID=938273 RepID=A0A0W8F3P8_9ZZZZ
MHVTQIRREAGGFRAADREPLTSRNGRSQMPVTVMGL